jgi:acetyl-CoA carboxylase carboxyltransferase component
VPTVAVVSGYCFAGNAALASVCDLIIATEGSSLGMGGPAMIEGGGLGVVAPGDVGPMSVQVPNGVVDVLVPDDETAVATARRYVSLFTAGAPEAAAADQRRLRTLVPESRTRAYDVRPIAETLADEGSLLEVRAGFGVGLVTAFARIGGRAVGIMANNPLHLGGAIDGDAADKASRFLELCRARSLPLVSLCDTPGFMVGPAAERTATVRRFGAMFVAGARLDTPVCMVVLRKAYGLGAMAMAGGDLRAPALTVAWPTAEFACRGGAQPQHPGALTGAVNWTRPATPTAASAARRRGLGGSQSPRSLLRQIRTVEGFADGPDGRQSMTNSMAVSSKSASPSGEVGVPSRGRAHPEAGRQGPTPPTRSTE